MIAVALIPPAATVGIGIAWGAPIVTLGSGVLMLVNVLSINLAALIVLWYSGYRPEHWFREDDARSATIQRVAALAVAIVVLSAFLGGVTYDSFTTATTAEEIRTDADEAVTALNASVGYDVVLLDVEIEYTTTIVFREPRRVVVSVGIPPDVTHTGLAEQIDERVDRTAGTDVETQVRYVPTESA
jgi:uncharacterized membrane protein